MVATTRSGAVAARRAHNPEVVGSNPTSATILVIGTDSTTMDNVTLQRLAMMDNTCTSDCLGNCLPVPGPIDWPLPWLARRPKRYWLNGLSRRTRKGGR